MTEAPAPRSELVLYRTEDGRARIECRFEVERLWLTQAQFADLLPRTLSGELCLAQAEHAASEVV
jgi:hypothetical protein